MTASFDNSRSSTGAARSSATRGGDAAPAAIAAAPAEPGASGTDRLIVAGRARRLALLFAEEPELIRACLENIERESAETLELILTAAQAALTVCPQYADLLYHASQAAMTAGQYETAARLLESALRINPGYRDALVLAARVSLRRGKGAEARAYLNTALAQGAEYPDVYLLLGNVWRDERKWNEARASYRRALELNANLTAARDALAALPPAEGSGKNDELSA